MDEMTKNKPPPPTHATSNLRIRLNLSIEFYHEGEITIGIMPKVQK
jgi:hypothetical protein